MRAEKPRRKVDPAGRLETIAEIFAPLAFDFFGLTLEERKACWDAAKADQAQALRCYEAIARTFRTPPRLGKRRSTSNASAARRARLTATLALSDMIRPLGRFDTWTNRRVAVRGPEGRA